MDLQQDGLTDDELVAMSVGEGRPWPVPLPTVDVEDETAVALSAMRGLRSLALRGGLVDGELAPALRRLTISPTGALALLLHSGDTEGNLIAGPGFGLAVVPTGDGFLLDEISATGVHVFRIVTEESEIVEFFAVGLGECRLGTAAGATCLTVWADRATTFVADDHGVKIASTGVAEDLEIRAAIRQALASSRENGLRGPGASRES